LKMLSVSDAMTLDGKVFQTRGAATKNARSPIVVRHEDGGISNHYLYGIPHHLKFLNRESKPKLSVSVSFILVLGLYAT